MYLRDRTGRRHVAVRVRRRSMRTTGTAAPGSRCSRGLDGRVRAAARRRITRITQLTWNPRGLYVLPICRLVCSFIVTYSGVGISAQWAYLRTNFLLSFEFGPRGTLYIYFPAPSSAVSVELLRALISTTYKDKHSEVRTFLRETNELSDHPRHSWQV